MKDKYGRRRSKGFTLVEVLVVVFIIEVLVVIALPSYINSVYQARQETANSNSKSLAIAVQSHAITASSYDTVVLDYATDLGGSVPLNPCTATTTGYTITATATTATVTAGAGTNCGTWTPVTYSLTL